MNLDARGALEMPNAKTLTVLTMLLTGAADAQPDPRVTRIDQFVRRAFALNVTPGIGLGVAHDGRIVYTAALGYADASSRVPATDSTLWYVASTSKSFTGFAIALLEHSGTVDVSAPITTLLPNVAWHPEARAHELTLASFLAHTHGIESGPTVTSAAFTGAFTEDQFAKLLAYSRPRSSRTLEYSNVGYNVASMVIAAKHPPGWKAFLDSNVFAPAGLRDIHHRVTGIPSRRIARAHDLEPDSTWRTLPFLKRDLTMNAAGGHIATIRDLLRWTILHTDEGRLEGRQIFPATVIRRSHEILGTHDRQFAYFQRDGWGFGWDIGRYDGEPMVSRFGSYTSFRSHLSMLPRQRLGFVAQTNGGLGSPLTDIIAAYVFDVFLGKADADARGAARLDSLAQSHQRRLARATRQAAPAPSRPLDDYVGMYEDEGLGRIDVRREGDTLRMRWGVLDVPLEVRNAERHLFAMKDFAFTAIQFVFTETGRAVAIDTEGRRAVRR